eukprot:gb/GECH01000708.1/.p1 GENE.gb/GECH01000708.1/~~gb/GECH01000708.1/.p1  ORF type:complete len:479 (+),score=116.15 gb/GECH01000708.1/:1-1437(+)
MMNLFFQPLIQFIPPEYHSSLNCFNNNHISTNETNCNTIIPLNMVKGYTSHLPLSVKEHVQNWRDQCFKLTAKYSSSVTTKKDVFETSPKTLHTFIPNFGETGFTADLWSLHFVNENSPDKLLGWIIQINSEPNKKIILFNAETVLSPDILRFGHSNKRNEPTLAGYFGDGMKPEINRLMSNGAQVLYRTGNQSWQFGFDSTDSLCCQVIENNNNNTKDFNTLINSINDLPKVREIKQFRNLTSLQKEIINNLQVPELHGQNYVPRSINLSQENRKNITNSKAFYFSLNYTKSEENSSFLAEFQDQVEQYGKTVAFHGTLVENVLSILVHGLRNQSNTTHMSNGAAFGQGIYLSDDFKVAQQFTSQRKTWANSTLITGRISCVLVCEVVRHPSLFFDENHENYSHPSSKHLKTSNRDQENNANQVPEGYILVNRPELMRVIGILVLPHGTHSNSKKMTWGPIVAYIILLLALLWVKNK